VTRGAAELFTGVDWAALTPRQVESQFKLQVESDKSAECFDPEFTSASVAALELADTDESLEEDNLSEVWTEPAPEPGSRTPHGPLGSDATDNSLFPPAVRSSPAATTATPVAIGPRSTGKRRPRSWGAQSPAACFRALCSPTVRAYTSPARAEVEASAAALLAVAHEALDQGRGRQRRRARSLGTPVLAVLQPWPKPMWELPTTPLRCPAWLVNWYSRAPGPCTQSLAR
jgi:hypothetical protein